MPKVRCIYIYIYCRIALWANLMCFPAVQKFWKSVKVWQRYRDCKGGNFFETQCRLLAPTVVGGRCPLQSEICTQWPTSLKSTSSPQLSYLFLFVNQIRFDDAVFTRQLKILCIVSRSGLRLLNSRCFQQFSDTLCHLLSCLHLNLSAIKSFNCPQSLPSII